jgi:hypothetical protein
VRIFVSFWPHPIFFYAGTRQERVVRWKLIASCVAGRLNEISSRQTFNCTRLSRDQCEPGNQSDLQPILAPPKPHGCATMVRLEMGWTMFWLISLGYGAAVLIAATALVFVIIWLVEKLAPKDARREHARTYRPIRWWGSRGSVD